jgi:hypothetical protein
MDNILLRIVISVATAARKPGSAMRFHVNSQQEREDDKVENCHSKEHH